MNQSINMQFQQVIEKTPFSKSIIKSLTGKKIKQNYKIITYQCSY